MKISLNEIREVLWSIYQEKKQSLSKKDVDACDLLPSYNTCLRNGLLLFKLNQEFSIRLNELEPSFCQHCLCLLPLEKRYNKFCNASCSARFSNNERTRPKGRSDWVYQVSCENCLAKLSDTYIARKYCDQLCQSQKNYEENFRDWYETGKYFQNPSIRKFLTTWKGYSCECCGISEWNGKSIVLEVEHISGNSEDSSPENVCLICPNCHSQTPTYKARNIGNGRHSRKMRYQEGKSY